MSEFYFPQTFMLLLSHLNFPDKSKARNNSDSKKEPGIPKEPTAHIAAQTFTFRELAAATKNFRPECLIGEGGFGRVYKGKLESGQVCWFPCKSITIFYINVFHPHVIGLISE